VSDEQPFCAPRHHRTIAPVIWKTGEAWRLRKDGRTQACEVRDNGGPGLGWDVRLIEEGELLFARRCADEEAAQFVARASDRIASERDGPRKGSLTRCGADVPAHGARVVAPPAACPSSVDRW
jgi:hypothetical protein